MALKQHTYRYQALNSSGGVISSGDRLKDVEHLGKRIIVDFKLKRWTRQGVYPQTRYSWHTGLEQVGSVIRRS
jgi:hypothetical protein